MKIGQDFLNLRDVENGLKHLCLAVAVCDPDHKIQPLFDIMKKHLTSQEFSLLLKKLDLAQNKIRSHVAATIPLAEKESDVKKQSEDTQKKRKMAAVEAPPTTIEVKKPKVDDASPKGDSKETNESPTIGVPKVDNASPDDKREDFDYYY